MSTYSDFHIRRMTQDEVERVAIEWAAQEGWNPGLYDAASFYAADPDGFLVGLINDEPVACISAVTYPGNFAFLGFYIVAPSYRGKNYGLKIWNAAMARLQNYNIGLDGVIEQQPNYIKSGFSLAYSNIRYEGTAKPHDFNHPEIVPVHELSFDELVRYDARHFPAVRPVFLKHWFSQPESASLAVVHKGKIAGIGHLRKCRAGYKIGPLFADTPDIAEQLFCALGNFATPEEKLYLDTPEINPAAVKLAESYGMEKVFSTARMYTKNQPNIDLKQVYGVTSFELG
ncbi:MAG: GNAT family N-acetyltransferase [Bacteroidales bacterium]|nr:GNAT family N-acetyltransferase [Bacteroidales bacterium]